MQKDPHLPNMENDDLLVIKHLKLLNSYQKEDLLYKIDQLKAMNDTVINSFSTFSDQTESQLKSINKDFNKA